MLSKVREALSAVVTPAASSPASSAPGSPPPPGSRTTHVIHREEEHALAQKLIEAGVPTSLEDCRGCDDPCEDEIGGGSITHVSYGKNFDVDWDSELLGSAKPSQRSIVVSTGKSDWPHDHTSDKSSLSYHINNALESSPSPAKIPPPTDVLPGLYSMQNSLTSPVPLKTGLFSSSLISQSTDCTKDTVLVFPDWIAVTDVENSKTGAKELVEGLNGKGLEESQGLERKVWTLPYRAVVLLCSHKRRDKRCHIAAPLLEKALIHQLEARDVTVDLKGESLSCADLSDAGSPLSSVDPSTLSSELDARLRSIPHVDDTTGGGQVGIFRISHLGGHRYAGVMIICFPSGAQLYYGRVSPHEIEKVVDETILGGKVLAGLLRAGGNVVKEGKACEKKGILAW